MATELEKKLMKINGVEKAKELKSQTKVKAILLLINGNYYTVVATTPPPGFEKTSGYPSTKNGKVPDYSKMLSITNSNDLYRGALELIMILDGDAVINEKLKAAYHNLNSVRK